MLDKHSEDIFFRFLKFTPDHDYYTSTTRNTNVHQGIREAPLTWSFNSFFMIALTGGLKAHTDSKHPETELLYGTMVCDVSIYEIIHYSLSMVCELKITNEIISKARYAKSRSKNDICQ